MTELDDRSLDEIAGAAVAVPGVESAAIFAVEPGATSLRLAGAAGITGPALDGLAAAVRNPAHPVARALSDAEPTIDVLPTAPGGPRLRSHFPLHADRGDGRHAVGVLAVAHDAPLLGDQRRQLADIAGSAAAKLAG